MATFASLTSGNEIPIEVIRRNVDHLGIKFNELPQRPFWASLFGRSEQDFKILIAARIMAGSALTGRELTQPEKDALSQHYAKFLNTQAYDTPIVAVSTLALYRGTYAKYGFPFWTPKADKFNPNKFPLVPKQYEGEAVQKIWHGLRLLAWFTGCKFVVSVFLVSYSLSVYVANTIPDPRLRDYHQAAKARLQQQRRPAALQPGQQTPPGFPDGQESSSPWASTEQSNQDSQSTWPGTQSPQPERAQAPSRDDDPYIFDDASPVAPTQQQKAASQQSTQGSAWDRIRSQVRPGSAAQGQGSAGQTSTWEQKREDEPTSRDAREGTSFSFSSGDEEKSYAKEQAQKDFDEMLERERRGEASGRR